MGAGSLLPLMRPESQLLLRLVSVILNYYFLLIIKLKYHKCNIR